MNETCSNDCRLSAKGCARQLDQPSNRGPRTGAMLTDDVNEDEVVPPTARGLRSPRSDAAAHRNVMMTKHTDDVAWTQPLASEDVQGVALGSCGRGAQNSLSAKGSMGAKGGCLRLGGRRRTHCASESLLYFCVDAASALC